MSEARQGLAIAWWCLGVGCLACLSCGRPATDSPVATGNNRQSERKPQVLTVNYPLAYFAERLAGDFVDVGFPAPADVDPAFWSPSAEQIQQYQDADLILDNGAEYAKWMTSATLPESKIVNTTASVQDELITVADLVKHSHGPGGEHAHGGIAFTVWLDPELAMVQAGCTAEALKALLPDHAASIQSELDRLLLDLQQVDQRFQQQLEPLAKQPWIASHPVYEYFARRYGLDMISMHWEPDQTPTEEQWTEFDAVLKEHPAKCMLWEDEPTAATRQALQQRGVEVFVLRPCGNRPAQGDLLDMWKL